MRHNSQLLESHNYPRYVIFTLFYTIYSTQCARVKPENEANGVQISVHMNSLRVSVGRFNTELLAN